MYLKTLPVVLICFVALMMGTTTPEQKKAQTEITKLRQQFAQTKLDLRKATAEIKRLKAQIAATPPKIVKEPVKAPNIGPVEADAQMTTLGSTDIDALLRHSKLMAHAIRLYLDAGKATKDMTTQTLYLDRAQQGNNFNMRIQVILDMWRINLYANPKTKKSLQQLKAVFKGQLQLIALANRRDKAQWVNQSIRATTKLDKVILAEMIKIANLAEIIIAPHLLSKTKDANKE